MSEAMLGIKPFEKPVTKGPKADLIDAIGSLDGFEVLGTQVLLAIYIRPEMTAGGIYRPDHVGARKEDQHQGTMGLILKIGRTAFEEDATHRWHGVVPLLHDWVLFNVSDALGLAIRGLRCRLIEDVNIRMVLPEPEVITDWIVQRPGR